MKIAIAKGAGALIGAGGLSVGGYYGYQALNKETKTQNPKVINIGDKLKNEKYTLLAKGSTYLNTVLTNYKASIKTPNTPDFAGFNGENANNETAEDILLRHCRTILSNENNANYEKAKKWCVEPISVSVLLGKRNITALDTISSDSAIQTQWSSKVKAYRSSRDFRIDGLTISSSGDVAPTTEEIGNIKKQCGVIKDKKNHEDKFEENLKAFEKWCSNS